MDKKNIATRMRLIESYRSAENLTDAERESLRAQLLDTMTDYEKEVFMSGEQSQIASLLAGYRAQAKVFEQRADDLKECALIFGFPAGENVLVQSGNKVVSISTESSEVDTETLADCYGAEAQIVLELKRKSITLENLSIRDFERAEKSGAIIRGFVKNHLPTITKRLIKLNVREVKKN